MIDSLDQKRIDQLYKLLHKAEQERNTEGAAALRWAIFQLEQTLATN